MLHVQSFFFLLIRKNSVPHVESYFFWLIRSIVAVFFNSSRCPHLVFCITRFYIFIEETMNIEQCFAFSPG